MKTVLKLFALGLTGSILLNSCSKNETIPHDREFIAGQVYFVLKNHITLTEAQDLMDDLMLTEFELRNFRYTTQTTFDSLTYFFDIFDNQQYLSVFDIVYDQDLNTATFRNMWFTEITDSQLPVWDSIIYNYSITEMFDADSKRHGVIYVNEGQEQYWIEELKKQDQIANADLMYFVEPWCKTGQE